MNILLGFLLFIAIVVAGYLAFLYVKTAKSNEQMQIGLADCQTKGQALWAEHQRLSLQYVAGQKENERLANDNKLLRTQNEQYRTQNDDIRKRWQAMRDENQQLASYRSILNAEEHANSLLRNAEAKAKELREEAQANYDRMIQTITERKMRANTEAANIIATANAEAQEKTKTSLEQVKSLSEQTEKLTQTINALRNKIDGYGIEYMIPGIGLLDNLAIDYGHTAAGQKLKEARALVRSMFRNRQAALCDYVELNRQETAITFVSDAFNGKVEEILSRVRHDNYGKLAQEIRDAAVLVDKNGAAFRNARVDSRYVDARLEELKWATIVHELKMREREEQRALSEQIREEKKVQKEIEKARKDAEKARKDVEKEFEREQKIYEELKAKFAIMSEQERAEAEAKHAQELEEIQERLRLAEEKNQRALSMAQQTKQGNIYVISNVGSFGENVYKIGMTRRLEPEDRVRELSGASVPFPFDIHGMIHFDDCPKAESQLHRLFVMNQVNKVNFRKEFFRVSLTEIKAAIEKMEGEAHWTMLAEAAQYRETLRIEERIQKDEAYRQEWTDRQIQLEELNTPTWDENEDVA